MNVQPELRIVTTAEHDKTAIHDEVADNESFYTMVILVSSIIIIVVMIL